MDPHIKFAIEYCRLKARVYQEAAETIEALEKNGGVFCKIDAHKEVAAAIYEAERLAKEAIHD